MLNHLADWPAFWLQNNISPVVSIEARNAGDRVVYVIHDTFECWGQRLPCHGTELSVWFMSLPYGEIA